MGGACRYVCTMQWWGRACRYACSMQWWGGMHVCGLQARQHIILLKHPSCPPPLHIPPTNSTCCTGSSFFGASGLKGYISSPAVRVRVSDQRSGLKEGSRLGSGSGQGQGQGEGVHQPPAVRVRVSGQG